MENITFQVFVSFVVSVIVSVATFLVGVRIGKEKSDRSDLRNMYKDIYQHLAQLRGGLDELSPKSWDEYQGEDGNSWPPIRRMERDGDIHMLPRKLGETLKGLEFDALKAGTIYRNNLESEYGPWAKHYLADKAHALDTTKAVQQIDIRAREVLGLESKLQSLRETLDSNPGLTFCVIVPRSRKSGERVYLYPGKVKPLDVLQDMRARAREELSFGPFVEVETKALIERIDAVFPLIERRIEDPHPIWQSLRAVFLDLRRDD